MSEEMALKIAIDLMHVPSQVRLVRAGPLPDGVPLLLRIAAGDVEAERAAVARTDRSCDIVRHAAIFFIEQILFAPNADSYQVLGASPQASAGELRHNVALLLKWLHPDLDPHGERSIFISKVTGAWNNLKTPERRAAYNNLRQSSLDRKGRSKSTQRSNRKQFVASMSRRTGRGKHGSVMYGAEKIGFFRRALSILLHRPLQ
jgi:hypothetical protein